MAKKKAVKSPIDVETLSSIAKRAQYMAVQMVHQANNRKDKEKGDPKVGGHVSAFSSALHVMGALHLVCKSGFDHVANKPHASPGDHAYNYLLDLFLKDDLSKLEKEEKNTAMMGLRKFSQNGEPVFQSYHSAFDCDNHNFAPSGTVGIPPVNIGYLAHAYRLAKEQGYEVPEAHFWAIMGDSEYREGSLQEALPDFAERELGNLTWIVDYNRQSLDGHRINNKEVMNGTDDTRIEKTAEANGWEVIQVRHGSFRQELFSRPGGKDFQKFIEEELEDYELQALLLVKEPKALRDKIAKDHKHLKKFLDSVKDDELYTALRDMGGHDFNAVIDALEKSKLNQRKPTFIIVHTVKGWGLEMAAAQGNHNMLAGKDEMVALREAQGLGEDTLFASFADSTKEGKFLKKRGDELLSQIKEQHAIKERNQELFSKKQDDVGEIPDTLDINLKMASYPHTQWMLGQLSSKLNRIANTDAKDVNESEKLWKNPAEMIISMAPDVGTSTNLNPSMDGKIFGAPVVEDIESELGVKDKKLPDLVPGEEVSNRFLRFDIEEGNVMSCMGSYGRIRDTLGIPLLPLMTVYDFFVKRAHDQYFYNLYWKSSFIMVGTPAGVSLSPEGAQHGWKSDFQIPNQITWEPFYCQEFDWIFSDAIKRHYNGDNEGRTGVVIRGTTMGVEQKDFIKRLRTQKRFKAEAGETLLAHKDFATGGTDESTLAPLSDEDIFSTIKAETLNGAYYLVDYRGYAGYEPGDNVVQIFAMGTLGREALKASDELLKRGIYANVIIVTSSDLLAGNLAHENDYHHMKYGLNVDSALYLQPTMNGQLQPAEVATLSGRRIPIVSVHDGEPGLLDNLGSIVGTKHISLAVRKHSKCGRPKDIFGYHEIDDKAIVAAAGKALAETALEEVKVSSSTLQTVQGRPSEKPDWRNLWPDKLN